MGRYLIFCTRYNVKGVPPNIESWSVLVRLDILQEILRVTSLVRAAKWHQSCATS